MPVNGCLFKIIFLCYRYESKVIQDICGDLHHKLCGKFSTFTKELVGLGGMEFVCGGNDRIIRHLL